MTTDMENELRELFRDKASHAPIATPAAARQRVLRQGRRHQVGIILGSAAVAFLVAAGSFAGLRSLLRDSDTFETGQEYDVFERTATIEAFTVTSPSDWYLVNQWPGWPQETENVLPVLQLSNVDLGVTSNACWDGLPPGAVALSVVFTGGHIIDSDPYGPWPTEFREYPDGPSGPCGGEGEYAYFTVSGWSLVAWVVSGQGVTEGDRNTLMAAVDSMSVDGKWQPHPSRVSTPGYVIAGGVSETGGDWRLEVRPGDTDVDLTLFGEGGYGTSRSFTMPSGPIEWTGTDPIFGAITRAATGVEFRSGTENENYDLGGSPVPGVILRVPPSLGSFDFDLFFIDPPDGYGELGGRVIALGVKMPSVEPPPVALPRGEEVQLSGNLLSHEWGVRFTGAFADGTACIRLAIGTVQQPGLCPTQLQTSLAGTQPSLHVWVTNDLALFAGSVPPDVVEIQFTSDDGTTPPTQFRCQMGPLGWTDPDKKVCALAFPPEGSGVFEYLAANGDVLFEEGNGWGASAATPTPVVDLVHGGTYWAVYPWVGAAGSREADDVSAQLLAEFGIEAGPGDLSCDQGAAEALGTDAEQGIAVYFETEDEANAFALQAGLLGHEAGPVIAQVTTYCLD